EGLMHDSRCLLRLRPFLTPRCAAWLAVGLLAVTVFAPLGALEPQAPQDAGTAAALALDKKIIEDVKQNKEIIPNLTYLNDVIGRRLTGSETLKRANDWTAQKMKEYGLENVHLEGWTIPVGWERGTVNARLVEPDTGRTLTMASRAWTPGTKGKIVGDV